MGVISNMKLLVTGGAGFIGSHLVDKLIDLGHIVTCIDDQSSTCNEEFYWNDKAYNVKASISQYKLLKNCMKRVDYVFHLAAHSRIQPALLNPLECIDVNVLGTANVLQAARECGVKKVIYSSTSSSYGLKNEPPLVETMPTDCLNPYSVSKVAGEELCRMYSELFGLDTITLRYFNVYGDRQPLKGAYAPVVGLFQEQKKSGESLTIVGDGKQRRDFTHVDDVVDANIKCMNDVSNEIINIGTGVNYSVQELANIISDDQIYIKERPGECRETLACNSKARSLLGWTPTINIMDWLRDN